MSLSTFLPATSTDNQQLPKPKRKQKREPTSWDQIKSLLTCNQIEGSQVHDPSKNLGGYSKLGSSCSSICTFSDVVPGSTRVAHRAANSTVSSILGPKSAFKPVTGPSTRPSSGPMRSNGGGAYSSSSRGMQLRKLSGCYECRTIVDPSRYPSARTTICSCSDCGEVFSKIESLELHQAVRHAAKELGPEDSGRNTVEIIFKSSWLKKDNPICKIERILKVHNSRRTIQRFEDSPHTVKARINTTSKKNPRCAADGNELLRFHCATLTCALGARGSSSLCGSVPGCGVCTIIRHGFPAKVYNGRGVLTTASSGRAHDCLGSTDGRRAMLVCRVIAGRVKRVADDAPAEEESSSAAGAYDSVAGYGSVYSTIEDLFVFNPRAILPCFVVIYKGLE